MNRNSQAALNERYEQEQKIKAIAHMFDERPEETVPNDGGLWDSDDSEGPPVV